jgi:hypothetical protein
LSLAARFTVMPRRGWLVLSALLFTCGCGTIRVPATTATNVIPWIAATPPIPTASPAPTIPTGTPPCTSQNLQVVYQGGQGLGGGQLVATIGFTNVSGTDCFLQGVPALSLIDAHGHLIYTVPSGYRITDRTDPVLLMARGNARQAYVPFAWPAIDEAGGGTECPSPAAATIRLQLPSAGGEVTLSTTAADHPVTIAPCHGLIGVGAFQADEPPVDATPPPQPFTYRVAAPTSVRAGDDLHYTVTLTNITDSPVTFRDPCPMYQEDLYSGAGLNGAPLGKHFYLLNCQPIGSIAARVSVTFAMVLDVPFGAAAGRYTLLWSPLEIGNAKNVERVPIEITH